MQPTIDALLSYYASHPENARVLYEVGGAYDTAGQEDIARRFYEKALAAGLVRTPDIERYKPAITGNAAYIRSMRDQHL